MGELVTFIPKASAKTTAARSGLPATIVIFPGVRYERGNEARQSLVARQEKSGTADSAKA